MCHACGHHAGEFQVSAQSSADCVIFTVSAIGLMVRNPLRCAATAGPGQLRVLWITVPGEECHPLGTVVEIELESPLDIYASEGQVVTQN